MTTKSTITRRPRSRAWRMASTKSPSSPAADRPREVDDVVAVVAVRRRVERHQPQAGGAEAREVVDALDQAGEVAAAVAVEIVERLDVEAVDDGVLPPQVAAGARRILSAGRRARGGAQAAAPRRRAGERALMRREPQLRAALLGLASKRPCAPGSPGERRVQVVGPVGRDRRRRSAGPRCSCAPGSGRRRPARACSPTIVQHGRAADPASRAAGARPPRRSRRAATSGW